MSPLRTAVWMLGAVVPAVAAAQDPAPPTIDCALGFQGLRTQAETLSGAQHGAQGGFDILTLSVPEKWRVELSFTTRWHPAYPAVTLRTFRKQVTGVWTAESKSCGYGSQDHFAALVEDMKNGDKALTDASRAEVERRKQSQSPLAPP